MLHIITCIGNYWIHHDHGVHGTVRSPLQLALLGFVGHALGIARLKHQAARPRRVVLMFSTFGS